MGFSQPMSEAKADIMAVDLHNEANMGGSKLVEKSKELGGPDPTATIKSHTYTLGKHSEGLKRGPISGSNP
jgi:hypothetical protein